MAAKKPVPARKAPDVQAPLEHRLIEFFWTLGPAFTRWAESRMHQHGLSPQRVRLLSALKKHGPRIMSELRDDLGVTAANITALVDVLEEEGMVARRPHPTDRRAIMIENTAKAEKWITKNCEGLKDRVAEIFSDFNVQEQEQLASLLAHMRNAFIKRGVLEVCERHCSLARKETVA